MPAGKNNDISTQYLYCMAQLFKTRLYNSQKGSILKVNRNGNWWTCFSKKLEHWLRNLLANTKDRKLRYSVPLFTLF